MPAEAFQRHIERQIRGRQIRLDKQCQDQKDQRHWNLALLDGRWSPCDSLDRMLNACQKDVAERMLHDFHCSGVDEDLEVLKAGWASHFKERPGQPQPKRPLLADLERPASCSSESEEFDEPRSILAAQGERAKQRLKGLEHLRQLAKPSEKPVAKIVEETGSSSCDWKPMPRSFDRTQSDSWAEWEARWAQAFRRLDEMEAIRRRRREEKERECKAHAEHVGKDRQAFPTFPSSFPSTSSKQGSKPRAAAPTKSSPSPAKEVNAAVSQASPFHSFADFCTAWSKLEKRLASGVQNAFLTCLDIPWPDGLPSVSGITASDTAAEAKKKLRTALLRWHPDKWTPILEHIAETDRVEVIARVKNVTQRLLEEKKRMDGH
ncbi:Uncharacterized protein SCF082_LOCUS28448 [Durusdinium trenchii]|uniref:J domain-containing protein n=1 Tax=Durusdinium trenchii TaxID=1381693 RepID=A0ABP0MKB9_9DINO